MNPKEFEEIKEKLMINEFYLDHDIQLIIINQVLTILEKFIKPTPTFAVGENVKICSIYSEYHKTIARIVLFCKSNGCWLLKMHDGSEAYFDSSKLRKLKKI